MKTLDIIDMSDKISAIQREYAPRYWQSEQAQQIAADLWGVTANEHGVIPSAPETVVQVKGCVGKIRFAKSAKGYWLIGLSGNYGSGGFDYAPSVWDKIGYASYQDARLAGVNALIDYFEQVANGEISTLSAANQVNAVKAVELLKAQRTPQLKFF